MAFDLTSEGVREEIRVRQKEAEALGLDSDKLAGIGGGFAFADGDILRLAPQVAKLVPLTGKTLETAKANGNARGYFVFEGTVVRGKTEIPNIKISVRQLYQPSVFTAADTKEDAEGTKVPYASLRTSKLRFGSSLGGLRLESKIPVLDREFSIKMTTKDVFVSIFDQNKKSELGLADGETLLRERKSYGIAQDLD